MNGLRNLAAVLENGTNEIQVDPAIGTRAVHSISQMLDFAKRQQIALRGASGD